MRWKGDISDMPMDWWEGKVAYCKYKGQMTIIKDDYGKDYKVSDLQAFKKHIEKYHSCNGKGNGSLHEENGYWFRVTEDFYNYIMSL